MSVILANSFDVPAVRAKLRLLLLFGSTTREHLSLIYQHLPQDYVPLLQTIADGVTEAIAKKGQPASAATVWNSIKNSQSFASISQAGLIPVLAAFDTSLKSSFGDAEAVAFLEDSNVRAHDWIKQLRVHLAARPDASVLGNVSVRDLLVDYDPNVQKACATSTQSTPMMWWLQPKQFAFFGAVLLDLTLVHEYLCHIIPANKQLEKDIREIWLHSGISVGIRNLPDPKFERHPVRFVWQMFRNGYMKQHNIDEFHVGGTLSLDDLTRALSGRPLYWTISLAILKAPDGQQQADQMARLFNLLSGFSDAQLDALQASGQTTIESLEIAANALQSMT